MEPLSQSPPLFESRIRSLKKIHQGKVRDIYDVDADHLLIVTTDRLSAFDVVLPDPIPHKGEVLTRISTFWFEKTRHIVTNQLTSLRVEQVVSDRDERASLSGRSMVVKKLNALPVEAVARGYLIGSGYKDYQARGSVCGIPLPPGLKMAEALPEPIFTPASKAPAGQHDENVDFDAVVRTVGREYAESIRRITLALYAAQHHHRGHQV
jgi:phosphoribosylaminoimidazole-succinocarboxamide synthase